MDRTLQELVWRRANRSCEYCRVPQAFDRLPFEIDHIIAEQHEGPTEPGNLCLCCFACNRYKGPNIAGRDPESGNTVPLFNPRRQRWTRHFRWDGPLLIGRTQSGRATVHVLKINLEHRAEFRRALIAEGVFPPA